MYGENTIHFMCGVCAFLHWRSESSKTRKKAYDCRTSTGNTKTRQTVTLSCFHLFAPPDEYPTWRFNFTADRKIENAKNKIKSPFVVLQCFRPFVMQMQKRRDRQIEGENTIPGMCHIHTHVASWYFVLSHYHSTRRGANMMLFSCFAENMTWHKSVSIPRKAGSVGNRNPGWILSRPKVTGKNNKIIVELRKR